METQKEVEDVAGVSPTEAEPRKVVDGSGKMCPIELKRRTAHGAFVSLIGQGSSQLLRLGSMMVLARLVLKEDFGLVNMVTAFVGLLNLFREAGLSMASVQRSSIVHAQISTLFWINLAVGVVLAGLSSLAAPMLVTFYGEPRLFWITLALSSSFIFSGAAAQHRAILQREMRFLALSVIDIVSLLGSILPAITMAAMGMGYWALVVTNLMPYAIGMAGAWVATRWVPGLPRRGTGVRSMLWYGGTITLNGAIVYLAYNVDKVLIGRFLGAEALGIYGRAYQLVNLPAENLNSTVTSVAFPALARIQHDTIRLKSYFLRGYGLFLSVVLPITVACALFPEDIIRVLLGAKWGAAAPIFQLLSPTILAFALINPFGSFLMATGRTARSLRMAFVIAPVVVLGYVCGLRWGANGVAAGFSIAMVLLVVPMIWWARQGTLITLVDVARTASTPLLAVAVGAATVLIFKILLNRIDLALLRLLVESTLLFAVYGFVLLVVLRQKSIYIGLLREVGLWKKQ